MMKTLGLYLHIPFCRRKCNYCDFYSVTDCSYADDYAEALMQSLRGFAREAREHTVDSVFIGGGTPILLGADRLHRLLSCIKSEYNLSDNPEITVEANPESIAKQDFEILKSAGVNRISLGFQSATPRMLKVLGRCHNTNDFVRAVDHARSAGIAQINADLMYSLPDQSIEDFLKSVDFLTELPLNHISMYLLKIEPDTPFGKNIKKLSLPDEDTECQMYLRGIEVLRQRGFEQYEISNFAKPGSECRHNLKYWKREEYLGFGPASHSFFDGKRFSLPRDLKGFCSSPPVGLNDVLPSPIQGIEAENEYIMLAFRLTQGIDKSDFSKQFGIDFDRKYAERIRIFLQTGHMEKTPYGYRLTPIGFLISNYILSDILD